jgi:hypothetical protein
LFVIRKVYAAVFLQLPSNCFLCGVFLSATSWISTFFLMTVVFRVSE